MSLDKRNKHGVEAGQVWVDNDHRNGGREMTVVELELDFYPGGRAKCRLLGELKKGQREFFYVRLNRFNGTKRGYSLSGSSAAAEKKADAKKKVTKKKVSTKKKAAKKAGGKK